MQHESDHLDGKLIIDYLEPLVLRETAPKLREFELKHQRAQASGELASDQEIVKHLGAMPKPAADLVSGPACA